MVVRITRPWQASDMPGAQLDAGQVFRVHSSLAAYLLAMGCAEVVRQRPMPVPAEPRVLLGVGALLVGALLWTQRTGTAQS